MAMSCEAGSYLTLIDSCITQLKDQGPSGTCNESKEEEEECPATEFRVWGLGSEVWGLGFGVWGLGFGVWGLGFGVWGLGFGFWGFNI